MAAVGEEVCYHTSILGSSLQSDLLTVSTVCSSHQQTTVFNSYKIANKNKPKQREMLRYSDDVGIVQPRPEKEEPFHSSYKKEKAKHLVDEWIPKRESTAWE